MEKQKHIPRNTPRYVLLMLVAVVSVEIGRLLWWQYRSGLRGPMGLFNIPMVLCPFALLMGLLACTCIFLIGWSYDRTKSLLPGVTLIAGVFLIFQIPLPPNPPTPETLHFRAHRADYEAVVELIRDEALSTKGCHQGQGVVPPPKLAHVSAQSCLHTRYDEETGLIVEFSPLEYSHMVTYVEKDDGQGTCIPDSLVEQKIDDHWYVCQADWN